MAKKEITKIEDAQNLPTLTSNNTALDAAMAISVELAKSDIIPKEFQNKPANCLIAVELANRLKASPFMVMQNVDIIYSRPALRSAFIISCINNSGKYVGSLKFQIDDKETKCRAYAIEKETGEKIIGPTITIEMASKEGWLTKNGSKWKTLPGLMLRYRAASFFGRLYCPEILNGMYSVEEVQDMQPSTIGTPLPDVFGNEPFPEEPQRTEEASENTATSTQQYEDVNYDEYYATQDEAYE